MVQEVRVESSNFDASTGHGTGLQTVADDARRHERVPRLGNYQHWTNKLNAMNVTQKADVRHEARAPRRRGRKADRISSSGRSAAR